MADLDFKNIKFGNSSAESEKTYSPDLLIDGYLDAYGYPEMIVNGHKFLIYGPKGSGKSAIGSRLELKSDELNINVKQYTLERFNYNSFENMTSNTEAPEIKNARSWEMILHVALLELFTNDSKLRSKSNDVDILKVVEGLKKIGAIPSNDLSSIVKEISKTEITADLKLLKYKKQTDCAYSYNNLCDNLRNAVNNSDLSKKQILVIDGLDAVITHRENQRRILSGLIHASKIINDDLHKYSVNAKIVILCRTDVLDLLEDPNKQKILDDYGIELYWYQHGVPYLDINLIKLVNLRASNSSGSDVDVFKQCFPSKIKGKDSYKFILDYTRYIPRDIIRIMNEIQKVYKPHMADSDFNNAIREYSANYFYGEIKDELAGISKTEDTDAVFRLLSGMSKYRFSRHDLDAKVSELNIKIDLDTMLQLLFNIGAIGNVKVNFAGKDEYSFKYRERYAAYNPKDDIVIHLALQNTLKVRGGYTHINEVDYD